MMNLLTGGDHDLIVFVLLFHCFHLQKGSDRWNQWRNSTKIINNQHQISRSDFKNLQYLPCFECQHELRLEFGIVQHNFFQNFLHKYFDYYMAFEIASFVN
jgi:hypothetical protein